MAQLIIFRAWHGLPDDLDAGLMSGKKVYNLRQAGRIFAKKDCIFNYDAIDLPEADIFKQILQIVGLSVCGQNKRIGIMRQGFPRR